MRGKRKRRGEGLAADRWLPATTISKATTIATRKGEVRRRRKKRDFDIGFSE